MLQKKEMRENEDKVDCNMSQLTFGIDTPESVAKSQKKVNPCIALYGVTESKKCKTCNHLVKVSMNKTWYKCELRRMSSCAASDHRVNWDACGKFEEIPE